jgi:hypothetical protein
LNRPTRSASRPGAWKPSSCSVKVVASPRNHAWDSTSPHQPVVRSSLTSAEDRTRYCRTDCGGRRLADAAAVASPGSDSPEVATTTGQYYYKCLPGIEGKWCAAALSPRIKGVIASVFSAGRRSLRHRLR